ncbi:MAG: DUF3575 domain-containing protein [Chitinophagaceae bacterium]
MQQNGGQKYLVLVKPLYLTILSLMLAAVTAAQQRPKDAPQLAPRYYEGKLFATLNITSLLDPITPTLQPGIEYRFSEKLSGELTFGIPVKMWEGTSKTDSTYNRYYKLKTELRFFPSNRFFYVGPAVFLTKKKYSDYDGGFSDGGDYYSYDFAKLDKTVIGIAIKAGRVFPLSEVFNLELFAGIGSRFVHLDAESTGLIKESSRPRWFWRPPERVGWKTTVHLETGLKMSRTIR